MINFCKNWCEEIIVAVIISVIIESILPEGNNKKYVKVVIGVYIIFTILNPFLGKLDNKVELGNMLNLETVETASTNTEDIQELYANGIKQTLKNNIEENFKYSVENLEIKYDEKYENIEEIKLQITDNNISKIQKIEIGNNTEQKEEVDYKDVKKYISENYEIDESRIIIN